MKVILICGKAGSGKDTFAKLLEMYLDLDDQGNYYERTYIRGNAQSVKDKAVQHYNWNGVKDSKGRQLLIDITNEGYSKDINFWEKETFTEAIMHKEFNNKNCEYLIIPDWRYPQTVDYFRKVADSVTTIRIVRPNLTEGTHKYHTSENALDLFDVQYEVVNDKDLDYLKGVAKSIVQRCCN